MGLKIFDLGLTEFKKAWQFQKKIFAQIRGGLFKSALILCRHYPVITLGRQAKRQNILISDEELKNKGITLYEVERAGDVTYHGPGQLMVYPIFNLNYFKKDIRLFLRNLEAIAIRMLEELGIAAERKTNLTGVWCGDKKISSIGISIKNWITYHGLAINIKGNDLANFSLIRPCGMDIMMTSAESVLGKDINIDEIKETVIRRWENDQSYFAAIRRGN